MYRCLLTIQREFGDIDTGNEITDTPDLKDAYKVAREDVRYYGSRENFSNVWSAESTIINLDTGETILRVTYSIHDGYKVVRGADEEKKTRVTQGAVYDWMNYTAKKLRAWLKPNIDIDDWKWGETCFQFVLVINASSRERSITTDPYSFYYDAEDVFGRSAYKQINEWIGNNLHRYLKRRKRTK